MLARSMSKPVVREYTTGVLSVYLRSTHWLPEKLRIHYQSSLGFEKTKKKQFWSGKKTDFPQNAAYLYIFICL